MVYEGLTPDEVKNKRFAPVRGPREGYDMEAVDKFLDRIEQSLKAHEDEKQELHQIIELRTARIGELERELEQQKHVVAPIEAPSESDSPMPIVEIEQIETLDKVSEAPSTVSEAALAAAKLLEHATNSAQLIVADARDEGATLLNNARDEAEKLKEDLHHKLKNQQDELDRAKAEALGAVEDNRALLDHRVAELRVIEATMRSDLQLYLSQLQEQVAVPVGENFHESEPELTASEEVYTEVPVEDVAVEVSPSGESED